MRSGRACSTLQEQHCLTGGTEIAKGITMYCQDGGMSVMQQQQQTGHLMIKRQNLQGLHNCRRQGCHLVLGRPTAEVHASS